MDTQIDEQQSLQLIRQMISQGKRNLKEGSVFYLIWGWAALLAGASQYVLLEFIEWQWHWVSWPILMTIAGIAAMVVGTRKGKKQHYVTFTDIAMKYLWGGFFLYVLVVLFMSQVIGWDISYVLIIGLYGLGTFISGGILQFKPLIIGGLLSIVICLVCVFVPAFHNDFSNVLLLLCLSILISYLVPGYMLRAQNPNNAT